MREQLIGYLLGALDASEQQKVEEALRQDPQLQSDLEVLSDSLAPLEAVEEEVEPPPGLAAGACERVAAQRQAVTPVAAPPAAGRWSLVDVAVASGIFLAAAVVFFPAVTHSRAMARRAGCENNLRAAGVALAQYSEDHHDRFPAVVGEDGLSIVGVYAPTLVDAGLIQEARTFICPSSALAAQRDTFRIPTLGELRAARGVLREQMHRMLGGSYGYSLGYVSNGRYHPTRNLRRTTFAIMSDSPNPAYPDSVSDNHGGCGQNVLYEDGHVAYLTRCKGEGCSDHIFFNTRGEVAPGTHANDAVIGPGQLRPVSWQ